MPYAHILSETVLTIAGFFSFFYGLRKTELQDRILWGTFILSVAIASFCAAIWFAGIEIMGLFNLHIKKISTTAGVIYLLVGVYTHIANVQLSLKTFYMVLLFGFLSLLISLIFDLPILYNLIPTIGIAIVFLMSLWAIKVRKYKVGLYLLLGTVFSSLANFLSFFNFPFDQIDAYCLLLACTLICFGMARKSSNDLHF